MEEKLFIYSLKAVKLIKERNYDKLKADGWLERLSKEIIENILADYGGNMTAVYDEEYKKYFRYIQIENTDRYITYLDLIIDSQRSDLTLICEIDISGVEITAVIDDLHVL